MEGHLQNRPREKRLMPRRRLLLKPMPKMKFDKRQLAVGTKVELEHTYSRSLARRIASQHLAESPDYYRELKKMERRLGIR